MSVGAESHPMSPMGVESHPISVLPGFSDVGLDPDAARTLSASPVAALIAPKTATAEKTTASAERSILLYMVGFVLT